jgi:hypothetical protein
MDIYILTVQITQKFLLKIALNHQEDDSALMSL